MGKKPTGNLGVHSLDATNPGIINVQFPTEKAAIELYVANSFVSFIQEKGLSYVDQGSLIQNQENNNDFTVKVEGITKNLELMEAVDRSRMEGGYKTQKKLLSLQDLVDAIWKEVLRKSEHYSTVGRANIHLLIYPTDNQFHLNTLATQYLAYLANQNTHNFECIYYFAVLGPDHKTLSRIFPSDVKEFDISQIANAMAAPLRVHMVIENGQVFFDMVIDTQTGEIVEQ